MRECISQTISELKSNPQEFFRFLHELRKQDPKNTYSTLFLKGNVKPILIDIICANHWTTFAGEDTNGIMKPDPNKRFKLSLR